MQGMRHRIEYRQSPYWWALLLLGLGLLAACTWGRATPPPTATLPPTVTLPPDTPTPTMTPLPSPTPSPTPPCWLADVTAGQGQHYAVVAGSVLTLTWQVQNVGSCTWTAPLELIPLADADLPGGTVNTPDQIAPGATVALKLTLTVPDEGGDYHGRWQLVTGNGEAVPGTLQAEVRVMVPTATPTATPGAPVFIQRQVDLSPGNGLNFDDGLVDVTYNGGLGHKGDFVYFYGPLYFWPPDIADCYNAPYNPQRNAISDPSRYVGLSFCYTTNEGRVGALHIDAVYTDDAGRPHLVLTYITWAAKRKKR